jgi:uncharacterized protein (DUF2141 family)
MKCLILICLICWDQSLDQSLDPKTYDLAITITGIKSNEGKIQIGLYNKKESFPHVDGQYRLYYFDVKGFSGVYTIRDLPKGEYAVAIFHDKNSDKICNTNFLGVPKEGFGFSKNFKPRLSSPDFEDCKIVLDSNMSITIKLIYR